MAQKPCRKSVRLKEYDYSSSGYYFITICIQNRKETFGRIESSSMKLNKYGKLANQIWKDIANHYPNVELDDFVIMPNHIHGIIIIDENVGTEQCSVPTHYGLLSKIVKSFKEIFIKTIHKQCEDYQFKWRRSFYDRIIRNDKELFNIRQYITNNPLQWELDNENPINWENKQ